jgi:hypothetical protein
LANGLISSQTHPLLLEKMRLISCVNFGLATKAVLERFSLLNPTI